MHYPRRSDAAAHPRAGRDAGEVEVCVTVLIRNLVLSGYRLDGADEYDSYRNATVQTQFVASACTYDNFEV